MFNYLKGRLYADYIHRNGGNSIDFVNVNNKIVATLFPREQVINIFLSASPEVVWNHCELAIFVIAKRYPVLNNGLLRKTEAAWLVGCIGANWEYNLNSLYLDAARAFERQVVSGISWCHKLKSNNIQFKLFDLDIVWSETPQPYSHIDFLNPALVYPVKRGGMKVKKASSILKQMYDWEYGVGYTCLGSLETRDFIDNQANKVNHTDFSHIYYHRVR